MEAQCIRDLCYSPSTGNIGDLFLPEQSEPANAILLIHGGGWSALDRFSFEGVALYLQSQGFVVFNIEYRLTGSAFWPACGDDCLEAAYWLARRDFAQAQRIKDAPIAVVGASAGGHLALMTALRMERSLVAAGVSISGITDLELYIRLKEGVDRGFWGHAGSPEEYRAGSPVAWISRDMPPVLLTHCPEDTVVDYCNAEVFRDKALAAGGSVNCFPTTVRWMGTASGFRGAFLISSTRSWRSRF